MRYSFIVPYCLPIGQLVPLLDAFARQHRLAALRSYELILVQDGGRRATFPNYTQLPLVLLHQRNQGPAIARNLGAKHAKGHYLVFLDADTCPTAAYFEVLNKVLTKASAPLFGGGAEALPPSSTLVQCGMHYAMTSWLSTGGIRGQRRSMEHFKPRTHNMFVTKSCFEGVGGFAAMRYGEDIDFALRMIAAGYEGVLVPNLLVYHWRKATMGLFFKQVQHSGSARVRLTQRHPGSLRVVHFLPVGFVLWCAGAVLLWAVFPWLLWVVLGYVLLVWGDALARYGLRVAGWGVVGVLVQLCGYGWGFIRTAFNFFLHWK